MSLVEINKGRNGSLGGEARSGSSVGCNRAKLGGGGKEGDMESSSSKLYVFGMYECDQDAFFGKVDTISGEELMGGGLARGWENGTCTGQGEKQKQTARENCVL